MIIAIHIPSELEEQFKADRFQSSLHRLRKVAQKFNLTGGVVEGEALLTTDVKLMQTLEASICLAREVANKDEILINTSGKTRGGSR